MVRTGANLGYSRAANEGARDGDEPWIVVVNPDIVWSPARSTRCSWRPSGTPGAGARVHVGGTSWRDRPARMIRAHHASARRYLHHRYDRPHQAPLRLAITIGLALRQAVELRRSH